MNNKMVSIVTPSLNGGKYIEDCINSIISQSYKNIEHIIVDGGSQDDTIEIIKKYENRYNMKWLSEPDNGMYDAINKGFELAEGDIYCWLNTDDMYLPWTLEIVSKCMDQLNINWVTGVNTLWSKEGLLYNLPVVIPFYTRKFIIRGYYHGRGLGFIPQASTFWTKRLWKKSGGLDPTFQYAGDFHLWRSFAEYEKLYIVNTILGGHRKHAEQKTNQIEKYYEEIDEYASPGWKIKLLRRLLKCVYIRKFFKENTLIYLHNLIDNEK